MWFPEKWCDPPDRPVWSTGGLGVRVTVRLSWLDRLRVMCTGVVIVDAKVLTERNAGRMIAAACVYPGWFGADRAALRAQRETAIRGDACPECGGELDTGFECNGCGRDFQAEALRIARRDLDGFGDA